MDALWQRCSNACADLSCYRVAMQDQYDVDRPEPWYIRRGAHKGVALMHACGGKRTCTCPASTHNQPIRVHGAAFAVASLEEAEMRLKHYKLEYHKFLVPGKL